MSDEKTTEETLDEILADAGSDAADQAEAGYADQSHLVRDCRAFLGEPPTSFAARAQT